MTDENLPLWEVSPIDPADPAWEGWSTAPQRVRALSENDAIGKIAQTMLRPLQASKFAPKSINPWQSKVKATLITNSA